LLESSALAHLVTVDGAGRPNIAVVWVGLDGDEIVSGHLDANQRKLRNIRRDSRVALSIESGATNDDGLREYLVIHGWARLTEGGAPELLQRLALVYLGPDVRFPPSTTLRQVSSPTSRSNASEVSGTGRSEPTQISTIVATGTSPRRSTTLTVSRSAGDGLPGFTTNVLDQGGVGVAEDQDVDGPMQGIRGLSIGRHGCGPSSDFNDPWRVDELGRRLRRICCATHRRYRRDVAERTDGGQRGDVAAVGDDLDAVERRRDLAQDRGPVDELVVRVGQEPDGACRGVVDPYRRPHGRRAYEHRSRPECQRARTSPSEGRPSS
jgi:PPOX class probable F420-dependent enzyme